MDFPSKRTLPAGRFQPIRLALGVFVAAALLALSSGVTHAGALGTSGPGQPVASEGIDSLTCAPAPVSWTDCNITLNRAIPAGGSVVAALTGAGGTLAYCSDGSPLNAFCATYGTEAVFFCPEGCAPGQQFDLSAIGTSPTALAQSLNVALGPIDLNWPGPGGLPSASAAIGTPDAISSSDVSSPASTDITPAAAPADAGGN